MVDVTKRRLPILLTILLSLAVAISGIGLLSLDYAQAAAKSVTETEQTDETTEEGDGMTEDGGVSAAFASPTGRTSEGYKYWNFGTSASIQSITGLPKGYYRLQVWGAKGGNDGGVGGNGGYAEGVYTNTTANATLYVVTGGVGATSASGTGGGYNGGGNAGSAGSSGAGGGATHIATATGLLASLSGNKAAVKIVAGGGGGGGNSYGNIKGAPAGVNGDGCNAGTTAGAGGAGSAAGVFGRGGHRSGGNNDGGGGGGGYGGGGASAGDGGGAGGSGYIGGVTSAKGYTARIVNGNAAMPTTTVNATSGWTGSPGGGYARITFINRAPVAVATTPTIALSRQSAVSVALKTTLGTDADGDSLRVSTAGIYTTNSAATANNASDSTQALLSYSAAVNAESITNLRATRYWSGTKTFYVLAKDYNATSGIAADCCETVWLKFNATCAPGTLTAQSGPTSTMDSSMFNYGLSTTRVAKDAQSTGGSLFNPVGDTGRRTLWLRDALSTESEVTINVADLFRTDLEAYNAVSINANLVYGTYRYENNLASGDNAVSQLISSATSGADSSLFTEAKLENEVTTNYFNETTKKTQTGVRNGYTTLKLKAKSDVAAGSYYYVLTINVNMICKQGGNVIKTEPIDIIYRVENTRPYYIGGYTNTGLIAYPLPAGQKEPLIKIKNNQTAYIDIADFVKDIDGNTLSIAEIKVPTGEYVAVDHHGYVRTLTDGTNYNYGIDSTVETYESAMTSAEHATYKTGFSRDFIYQVTAANADTTFVGPSNMGDADRSYVGFYVNAAMQDESGANIAARTRLYFVGNKASRYAYANGAARLGHFYIMVRLTDNGNTSDMGCWYPIAVEIESTAPAAANYPSVMGSIGDTFYFSPMGVLVSGSDSAVNTNGYFGIGAYSTPENNSTFDADVNARNGITAEGQALGKKEVLPLTYDVDNYSSVILNSDQSRTLTIGGASVPIAGSLEALPATWAQREAVFLTSNAVSALNTRLTQPIVYANNSADDVTNVQDGFKEFYTVERVPLYAKPSILLGLTDAEIEMLVEDGVISFVRVIDGSPTVYVRFDGLKITLKKYTMGKYLSFNVNVTDTHNTTATIRVAVNVQSGLTTIPTVGRDNAAVNARNFDKRANNDDHTDGTVSRVTREDGSNMVTFQYVIKKDEVLRISPYDIFYDPDTFTVNTLSSDGRSIVAYNTQPVVGEGNAAHATMVKGLNKKMAVLASDSPTEEPTTVTDFQFKKLTVAAVNQNPQVSGQDLYGRVDYVPEKSVGDAAGAAYAEHFVITGLRRTPTNGFVAFYYTVTTETGSVTAEIRVVVENSLPSVNSQLTDEETGEQRIFVLSARPGFNSSMNEYDKEVVVDEDGNPILDENGNVQFTGSSYGYFKLNKDSFVLSDSTYNIREFTLNDLFSDPDSDSVTLYTREIQVGTRDAKGNFMLFTPEQNVFVNAYIGAGSNYRAGYNNCLIIQGLSSTQGVPGGVWIRVQISDSSLGAASQKPRDYFFQVEVLNSPLETYSGDNAMEYVSNYKVANSTETYTGYLWNADEETTNATVANVFKSDPRVGAYGDFATNGMTSVVRPMYIASNKNAMDFYSEAVNTAMEGWAGNTPTHWPEEFHYSDAQVRYVVEDPDSAQGVSLYAQGYTGASNATWPTFNLISNPSSPFENGSVVAVSTIYSASAFPSGGKSLIDYYKENNIVQLIFFDDEGHMLEESNSPEIIAKAHNSTNWVIAFNFLGTDYAPFFNVSLRVRDGNNELSMPSSTESGIAAQAATAGGYNLGSTQSYLGKRTVAAQDDGNLRFVPNVALKTEYGVNSTFSFAVKLKAQPLYNNFSKWASNETAYEYKPDPSDPDKKFIYNLNNVWKAPTPDKQSFVYYFTGTSTQQTLFHYDGIRVSASTGSNTAVPLSYFAWAASNQSIPTNMDAKQQNVAWFDNTSISPESYKISNTFTGTGNDPTTSEPNLGQIQELLTLSDGTNVWTGSMLNQNPYVTFKAVYRKDCYADGAFSSEYLNEQQRFVAASAQTLTPFSPVNCRSAGYTFFEDQYGISMTKKSVRSVGNLTLTVRLAQFQWVNNAYAKVDDSEITVSVPLSVDNSPISLNKYSDMIQTSMSQGNRTLALCTEMNESGSEHRTYPAGTNFFNGSSAVDQGSFNVMINNTSVSQSYREDMFILADSISGSFTNSDGSAKDSLKYIARTMANQGGSSSQNTETNGSGRLQGYFGFTADDTVDTIFGITKDSGSNLYDFDALTLPAETKAKINPHWQNYFDLSPTTVDNKSLTITPKRMTTFRTEIKDESTGNMRKMTHAEIEAAAAERGLKVAYKGDAQTSTEVDYMYYPLKLIVYDRLSIGRSGTTFLQSSFDVITVNIRIDNSAPQVLKLNLTEDIPVPANTADEGAKTYTGRTLSLAVNDSATFNFTDLFLDSDMQRGTGSDSYKYLHESQVLASSDQLTYDTADYPKETDGKLVKVDFLNVANSTASRVTNEYNESNDTGAVQCTVATGGDSLTVRVRKRAYGYKASDVVSYIRITFTDRSGAYCQAVIAVKIVNAAPTLTQYASTMRTITMHTGEYFTLYTTQWSDFVKGESVSDTVGGQAAGVYDGTYFADTAGANPVEPASLSSARGNGIVPWSFNAGMPHNDVYNRENPSSPYTGEGATGASKKNLGYMAIATDDAPWTLRFDPTANTGGANNGVYVSAGGDKIQTTLLNKVRFEGATDPLSSGYTAVMFEALGACTDVTVTITLTDGLSSDSPQGLVFTFKITVISTGPKPIVGANDPDDNKLGASLKNFEGGKYYTPIRRLEHDENNQTGVASLSGNVYTLKMFAGERITLQTSDFATDIDAGDSQLLYLISDGADSPFTVNNVPTLLTQNIALSHRSNNALTRNSNEFTIEATNFHNENSDSTGLYDTIVFYICDPYYADKDAAHAIKVELKVYVYPAFNTVSAEGAGRGNDVNVPSVAEYNENGAYRVPLVSSAGGDGLIMVDSDADFSRTRYSVTLYTLMYRDEKGDVVNYLPDAFRALNDTQKAAQVVANFTINSVAGLNSSTTTKFQTENSKIVQEYISDLYFEDDGSAVYLVPNKATNGFRQMAGTTPARDGFRLYAVAQKYVNRASTGGDYGPGAADAGYGVAQQPAYSADGFLNILVGNSAPIAVGDTMNNYNVRGDGNPYLTISGRRADSWDFFVNNYLSPNDEALFTDPDGDALSYRGATVTDVYTLDVSGLTPTSYKNNSAVMESAQKAIGIEEIPEMVYAPANTETSATYKGIRLTILNKITIPNEAGNTVYVSLTVYGSDSDTDPNRYASTVITVGITNSAPVFKSEEEVDEKYRTVEVSPGNIKTLQNTYTVDENGNAYLTLTLSCDDLLDADGNAKLLSKNGEISIPLTDFIKDADYDADPQKNNESFVFVAPPLSTGRTTLSEISGHSERTLWVDSNESGISTDNSQITGRRFHIRVRDDNNSAIIFKVNSYERGATDQVLLMVEDASGSRTGTLTITLRVGNSAPISKLATGEASNRIVMAGGKEGTGNNGTFTPVRFSLFDYVRDNNPDDEKRYDSTPTDAKNYLRIMSYTPQAITFDDASDHSEYVTDPNDPNAKSQSLVNFIIYDQYFTVAPLRNLYGRQDIVLTISDDGNSGSEDSETIEILIRLVITKNPTEIATNTIEVYHKRSTPITAGALFADGNGLLVTKVEIASNPDNAVTASPNEAGEWSVYGAVYGRTVDATASVIVGDTYTEDATVYTIPFQVTVLENSKPEFKINDDNVRFDEGITYITKADFDSDGIWEVPLSYFFQDKEGDDLKLVSASSKKTMLIDVTADTQKNTLTFNFKSRGDTTVTVKLSDAVATYTYTFQIGNKDLPEPNFFIGMIARVQENPLIFILIGCGILLLLILLIIIIAAVRKKKKMRAEIEALLVSEMELEEQMLKLAAGPSPTNYQSYGYLPPTPYAQQDPSMLLGGGQAAPNASGAIGLNPGAPQNGTQQQNSQLPPIDDNFNDDDL